MNILSIETSCDETAVSIVRATGTFPNATYEVLGNALFSQIDIHREYGGVFPAVAKREHAKTIVPMLTKALGEAALPSTPYTLTPPLTETLSETLYREHDLTENLIAFLNTQNRPDIDLIAVTAGPGLEPALWVGINFAKALSLAWDIPLMPINHMEGHIFVSAFDGTRILPIIFPSIALLISGGHTELVLMRDWNEYELIGATRDDAVGEAFDKVARMLGLPYPGGPQISKLAEEARKDGIIPSLTLPRPMLSSDNFDFSFSGLKTAVLYGIKGHELTDVYKREVALAFEDAAAEVLVAKTQRALDEHNAQTLILGGGVAANAHIRTAFTSLFTSDYPEHTLYLPTPALTTDNAIMIALAAHARASFDAPAHLEDVVANGNKSLHTES